MRTWMEPAAAIILIPVITIAGQWLLSQQAAKAQYTDLVAKLEAARNTHTEQAGAAAQRNWSELSQGGDPYFLQCWTCGLAARLRRRSNRSMRLPVWVARSIPV